MGKWRSLTIAILLGMIFYGCGMNQEIEQSEKTVQLEQEEKGLRQQDQKSPETEEKKEDLPSSVISLWNEDGYPSTILEDETAVYFCGVDHIRRVEKESGDEQYIWEASAGREEDNAYTYSNSRGILINDKIYFIETWETQEKQDTPTVNYALAVVYTNGTGYERIKKIQTDADDKFVLLDGILYFEGVLNSNSLKGYPVDKDGNLITDRIMITEAKNVPDEYRAPYYYQNGGRTLTPVESKKRYGYYLLWDENYDLCKVYPDTGEIESLPANLSGYSLGAINDKYFLLVSYSQYNMILFDHTTGAIRILGEYNGGYTHIISMDDEYLYLQREVSGDDFVQYHYDQVDLESGKVTELFVTDNFSGMSVDSPWYLLDVCVRNGYVYYPGVRDYKFYIMRRNIDMPNAEEVLGSPFKDSKISNVGSIKTYKETIYSKNNPDKKLAYLNLEWLVVDERFSGSANINRILEEAQQENIEYEHENAEYNESWYGEDDVDYSPSYSFSSNVSPIYYLDDSYLSFVQQNYDYTGGAHGMPYWIGYVFNLQTGAQLGLSDVVADDELRIKELVTQYFAQRYNQDPDMFWDDAVDTVFEYTTLNSPFYLSDEGIVFYFGPYDLASYAAGFQEIVVPYSEFDLKIPLIY